MDYLNPDTKNIFDDGGQMSYYVSRGRIREGCELWEKGYRDREEFDIVCGLRLIKE